MEYGDRIEYDIVSHMYTIHRSATPERAAVDYTVSMIEVMKKTDPSAPWSNEIVKILLDECIDEQLHPIQRREAIEHTRRKLGL